MASKKITWLWPVILSLVVSGAYLVARLNKYDLDPLGIAEIGSRYADQEVDGEPGYDGQFSYYIARDLEPGTVEPFLDVPAYRYQRILYPLLARVLAAGYQPAIPWTLIAINWVAHALATLGICYLLHQRGIRPMYGLVYGLWVGVVAAVGLDLHEPLAYGLVAGAWFMQERGRWSAFALFLVLALFAKETTLLFWAAALIPLLRQRDRGIGLRILLIGGLFFVGWQAWLRASFGSFGLGSGGEMATGFEWIPFMGLIRIGMVDWKVFGLFLLIFAPTIILPTLWGLFESVKKGSAILLEWGAGALILHALLIVFLPFSTFREPLGLVRIATGLVLSILIVASERRYHRVLNYGLFWIAMLALLIPQA